MTNRTSLIVAIVLLVLLPLLYVGSYLALVIPGGEVIVPRSVVLPFPHPTIRKYKLGGELAEVMFWPLEQIDRLARPDAWRPVWESYPIST